MNERDRVGNAFPVIGILVMVLGVIHETSAIVIYWPELTTLLSRGFNGSFANPASEDAEFWSFMFGLLIIAAGQQIF